METKIENIKINETFLHAEYVKREGASFYLKVELVGPSDFLIHKGRIKCENVLPINFSFDQPFFFRDGYSTTDSHSWGNHYLRFTIKSNFNIEKMGLHCLIKDARDPYVKDMIYGIDKRDCVEIKLYEYNTKEDIEKYYGNNSYLEYTITCPDNKIVYVQGYNLSDYSRAHDGILHGNDYDNYLKNIDKVYIKYNEKDIKEEQNKKLIQKSAELAEQNKCMER